MDYAILVFAGAFATVMIIVALRIDHAEWLAKRKEKHGSDRQVS